MNPTFHIQDQQPLLQQPLHNTRGILRGMTAKWLIDTFCQKENRYICAALAERIACSYHESRKWTFEVGSDMPTSFYDFYEVDYEGELCSPAIIYHILKFSLTKEEMEVIRSAMELQFFVEFAEDGTPETGEYSFSIEAVLEHAMEFDPNFTKVLDRLEIEWKYWECSRAQEGIHIIRPDSITIRKHLLSKMDPDFVFPDISFSFFYETVSEE